MRESGEIGLKDLWPIIEEKLENGGEVTINPGGISMKPLVVAGRDSVILKKAPKALKKYDVALYKRKNGQFVLHRVVGIKNGAYVMCGDNQYIREYPVYDEDILAILKTVVRKEKQIDTSSCLYKLYSRFWVFLQTINGIFHKIRPFLGRVKRKILR